MACLKCLSFFLLLLEMGSAEKGGQSISDREKASTSWNAQRAVASDALGKFQGARYIVKGKAAQAATEGLKAAGRVGESHRALMADALGKFRGARRVVKASAAEPAARTSTKQVPRGRSTPRITEDETMLGAYFAGKFRPAKYVISDSAARLPSGSGSAERAPSRRDDPSLLMSDALGKFKGAKYIQKQQGASTLKSSAAAVDGASVTTAKRGAHGNKRKLDKAEGALSFELTNKFRGARYILKDGTTSDTLI
eukprot:TRINITY_DN1403_c0_g1_i2.p1 TRINITY_DN1403_c0_g1~~TRINITY_DN1403_c0_g1_i2.p1  ORF type:complete len:253 (+),score=48.14 TRINITY_DN1403_c0_g1_i2:80-838(+)